MLEPGSVLVVEPPTPAPERPQPAPAPRDPAAPGRRRAPDAPGSPSPPRPARRRSRFQLPPRFHNAAGEERRVGFELEYAGLPIPRAARLVRHLFGGRLREENRFVFHVEGTSLGDFRVEMDSSPLRRQKHRDLLTRVGLVRSGTVASIESVIESVAGTLVPYEIVTPPLRVGDLEPVERLQQALRRHRARGTGAAPQYAFGLHLNPEAPALDAATLLATLRAFLLLADWIVERNGIDLARRLAPYIKPFPEAYQDLVLDPGYAPDLDAFAGDYLRHNPTRNRPLDLSPLLALVAPAAMQAMTGAADLRKVSGRPTFHYRLPDCRVDDPRWSVAREWNTWVEIERLADEPERLAEGMHERRRFRGRPRRSWVRFVEQWQRAASLHRRQRTE